MVKIPPLPKPRTPAQPWTPAQPRTPASTSQRPSPASRVPSAAVTHRSRTTTQQPTSAASTRTTIPTEAPYVFEIDEYILDAHLKLSAPQNGHEFFQATNPNHPGAEPDHQERAYYLEAIRKELGLQDFWSCIPLKHHPNINPHPHPANCHAEFLYKVLICIKLTQVQDFLKGSVMNGSFEVVVVPKRPEAVARGSGNDDGRYGVVYLSYELARVGEERRRRHAERMERDGS